MDGMGTVDGNQKSGKNPVEGQVVEMPWIYKGLLIHLRWLFGISEPSTVRLRICESSMRNSQQVPLNHILPSGGESLGRIPW